MSMPARDAFMTYEHLKQNYVEGSVFGCGSNDRAMAYYHRRNVQKQVAVKMPAKGSDRYRKEIQAEIRIMTIIMKDCDQILMMFRWEYAFIPYGPAIFLEYRLDFIHNRLGLTLCHANLKPANILVSRPEHSGEQDPALPNFKIGDFSRSVEYSATGPKHSFRGTPEYTPPRSERRRGVTPAVDIWALGATLQFNVYGIHPVQSRKSFTRANKHMIREYGIRRDSTVLKYSSTLNSWYSVCIQEDVKKRFSSKDLAKWVLHVAEREIKVRSTQRAAQGVEGRARIMLEKQSRPKCIAVHLCSHSSSVQAQVHGYTRGSF
ncbi:kinase-like protein [Lojkania enalia]|uniref:Kinase-like protein n=1 Tax=Lojkania enalia TaxID=147567 RepID=A0A9P4K856_9PLEO|nr:kinase-like protein [Didymosphaeria enalia]